MDCFASLAMTMLGYAAGGQRRACAAPTMSHGIKRRWARWRFAHPTIYYNLQTSIAGSRSLRGLKRYFENQAGRGGMRQQPAFGIGDARLGGGGAAADIQDPALGSHDASILGHAFDKTDLEFERGVAAARRQHGMHGEPHHGIQQRRGVTAMH